MAAVSRPVSAERLAASVAEQGARQVAARLAAAVADPMARQVAAWATATDPMARQVGARPAATVTDPMARQVDAPATATVTGLTARARRRAPAPFSYRRLQAARRAVRRRPREAIPASLAQRQAARARDLVLIRAPEPVKVRDSRASAPSTARHPAAAWTASPSQAVARTVASVSQPAQLAVPEPCSSAAWIAWPARKMSAQSARAKGRTPAHRRAKPLPGECSTVTRVAPPRQARRRADEAVA